MYCGLCDGDDHEPPNCPITAAVQASERAAEQAQARTSAEAMEEWLAT